MSEAVTMPTVTKIREHKPRKGGGRQPGAGRPLQPGKPKVAGERTKFTFVDCRPLEQQNVPEIRLEIEKMSLIELVQLAARIEAANGNWRSAAQIASMALPYLYPRLSAIETNMTVTNTTPSEMSSQDLQAMLVQNYEVMAERPGELPVLESPPESTDPT